jgi:hypothetical protein
VGGKATLGQPERRPHRSAFHVYPWNNLLRVGKSFSVWHENGYNSDNNLMGDAGG